VEYGLTGGLHSLDPKEIDTWLQRAQVGNAYVNRHITGAIVQRQPFGGWKRSSIGGGAKPGGPSHLHSYGTWEPGDLDVDRARQSFVDAWASRFGADCDPSGLRSESNILRHHPLDGVVIRAQRSGATFDVAMLAAQTTRTPVIWSDPSQESDEELAARLEVLNVERLRLLAPASDGLLAAAHAAGVAVDRQPVSDVGDVELPHWLKEQAISVTRHRHGRLLR
jgi:RHH-type proline utilization regulon transcriptional repressor/proline dehydrogenase/delta 1-pyrroline-5-carboxylate dehydrogenase